VIFLSRKQVRPQSRHALVSEPVPDRTESDSFWLPTLKSMRVPRKSEGQRRFFDGSSRVASDDAGTVVPIHLDAAAYEVEFVTLTGKTIAVTTVLPTQLRPVSKRDVTHVRELAVG
jgi:hypothetical protein